jgi:hypothetical protein
MGNLAAERYCNEGATRDINMAWGAWRAEFQSRFDKFTAKTEQMKEGVLRVL